jgi:SagB-type dehydrogenase family enzyme
MAGPVERARAVHSALNGTPPARTRPEPPEGRRVELPPAEQPDADLVDVLRRRRSAYSFAPRPLRLDALGALLGLAVGVQRFVSAYGADRHPLGMAPSAGGLPCLRAYAVVRSAENVEPGVYRYDAAAHELVERVPGDPGSALAEAYLQPEFAERAPVTLALTARLDVAFGKYPLRHYRTLHVDAGIAAQNLYLVATALGLSCCAVAGYDDEALAALLRLPDAEIPTLLFPTGHART